MRWKYLLVFGSMMLLIGCGNETEQGIERKDRQSNLQPINYETVDEQKNRLGERDKSVGELGGYPQSEQKGVNRGDRNVTAKNEDRYTNERTLYIAEKLADRKDVVQARVAETEDRILVAVMVGNKDYPELPESIEEEVRKIVPDKQIIVYTDKAWWDRMRDLNSNP